MAPRSVLITGCSKGGAGEALARHFKKNDFKVFATARSLGKVQHLVTEGIEVVELDVLDTQSIKNAVATVSGLTSGTLDILINNAGAGSLVVILKSIDLLSIYRLHGPNYRCGQCQG
jgi:1-acylglycerone phosphate reductase